MEPNANPNLSPCITHQPSLLGGAENMKLLFDDTMSDISNARKETFANARAWEALKLRIANNAADFDKAMNTSMVQAVQTGNTEGQQTVSPVRTGAADTEVQQPAGAVYPPIRNVDQSSATANGAVQTAIAQIAANIASMSDIVTKLSDALNAVLVTAAGGASTPSQTTPKPAA